MHIITGLVLARLLKARSGRSTPNPGQGNLAPVLNLPGVITLTHALPGRCRFRLPSLIGQATAATQIVERLGAVDGVRSIRVQPQTGSVLFEYDAARLNQELLAAALVRLLGLDAAFSGRVESVCSRELRTWARSLNMAVYQQTGGMLDLRTAVLLALAFEGIKQIVSQRALALPSGLTLLWWAGNGLLRKSGECE